MRPALLLFLMACGPGTDGDTGNLAPDPAPSETETETTEPPGISLDSDLRVLKNQWGVPSLAAAVVNGTEVLAVGASGKRREGEAGKVTWQDDYHLGSVTKAFTAMLVGRLVDQGSLTWDHALTDTFADADPAWDDVTVEMLLRHEGGTTPSLAETHPTLWASLWADGDADPSATRADFAHQYLAAPPSETPGSPLYSNAGYVLVGAVLEAELGAAWETLLQEEVLDPLDMTGCGFGPPMDPTPDDQPWGHADLGGGSLVPMDPTTPESDNPPALGPAGTLHCPLVEWARFGQAHLNAASGDTAFLSVDTTARLQTYQGTEFTAGMLYTEEQPWADGPALTLTGSNTLWLATIWIAPGIDRAYVTATNVGNSDAFMATNEAVLLGIELDD